MDDSLGARIAAARQQLAELEAQQATGAEHETTAGTASVSSGFWDTRLRRGEPEAEPLDEISSMSQADYAQWRSANGIGGHGEQNLSRRPGVTQASGQGMFDGLPGYADPRTSNKRAFQSELADTRRETPIGYARPDAGEQQDRFS